MDSHFQAYETLLRKWQKTINLVSPKTLDQVQSRHIADSRQLLPYLPDSPVSLYDLGSGAGFPGMVIGICRRDCTVHLIESDTRKTQFLSALRRELGLKNIVVKNDRVEKLALALPPPDFITARALGAIDTIFDLTRPWAESKPDLRYILPKGRSVQTEITQAQKTYSFDYHSAPSCTDPDATILRIDNVRPKICVT